MLLEEMLNSSNQDIRSFAMTYPTVADKVESWTLDKNARCYIFKLNNDQFIEYDSIANRYRQIMSPNEKRNRNEMQWRREFSFKLRRRLEDTRTTQTTLSRKTGISERIISRYVNGSSIPSAYNLEKIANVLNCDMNDLV